MGTHKVIVACCCWRATSPLATCNIDCSPPSHATGCQQNATHATALNEKRGVSVLMAHLGLELSSTDINSTLGIQSNYIWSSVADDCNNGSRFKFGSQIITEEFVKEQLTILVFL